MGWWGESYNKLYTSEFPLYFIISIINRTYFGAIEQIEKNVIISD